MAKPKTRTRGRKGAPSANNLVKRLDTRSSRILLAAAVLITVVSGYALVRFSHASSGMQVQGNQLLKDGSPYFGAGFNMIGVLSPPGCTNGSGVNARNHYTQAEMDAAKSWNASTLRLQVSQSGLATANTTDLNTYMNQIKNSVALARSNGFIVILSMQDQGIGCGPAHPLPTAASKTAWQRLAPAYADNPYVMYELFNEPDNDPTATGWAQWLNGGTSPLANQGDTAVGHQALLNEIRSLGANNVVLADGAKKGEDLSAMPMLKDTTSGRGVVYAAHPYYFNEPNPQTAWNTRLGYLTSSVPVMATEWNYRLDGCTNAQITLAPTFLAYLKSHNVTVLQHALDDPPATMADWSYTPTECGTSQGGSGKVAKDYMTSLPKANYGTPTPTPTPTPVPAPVISRFSASPVNVAVGATSTLSWNTQYTTGCSLTPGGPTGTTSTSWTTPAYTAAGTFNYTLSCLNSAGTSVSKSTTVTATPSITTKITAPADGASLSGIVTIGVSASSNVVHSVLTWDATHVIRDTTTQNTYGWGSQWGTTKAPNGTHTLTDTVYDAAGNSATSYVAVDVENNTSATGAIAGIGSKCVDNQSGQALNGNKIQLWTCSGSDNQKWTVSSTTNTIVNANGYCLDAKGAGTTAGTLVQLWSCNGKANQLWDVNPSAGTIVNTNSGLCLEDENASTTNGNQIWLNACTATNAQKWGTALGASAVDTTPPSAPSSLTGKAASATSVVLNWGASTDNVAVSKYVIMRAGTVVGTVPAGTLSYTDNTVAGSTTYSYTARAYDSSNNESAASNTVNVTTPTAVVADTTAPSTPTGLKTTLVSTSQINLAWTASTDNVAVTGYDVYKNGSKIATVTAPSTTYGLASLTSGTAFSFYVKAHDAAGNASSASNTLQVSTLVASDPVIDAAGDISTGTLTGGNLSTSDLVLSLKPTAVVTLGDNQYSDGAIADLQKYFSATWGRFKNLIHPAPGHHEYYTDSTAAGYYTYFGAAANNSSQPGCTSACQGYYSWNLGSWHLIALNTNHFTGTQTSHPCAFVSCYAGSAQINWLQQDLSSNTQPCTLAYWSDPRWSSGTKHGSSPAMNDIWTTLYAGKTDLALNGHEHHYERFAKQNPSGAADPAGIREINAGTGGNGLYVFGTPIANSQVRDDTSKGVLELTLHSDSYSWRFVPAVGSFTDSGTQSCNK